MTEDKKTIAPEAACVEDCAELTDEQFADLLTATLTTPESTPEFTQLQAALSSYRSEAMHWAQRRSAGRPSMVPAVRRSERWAALPQWSLALVALVTIAGGVIHLSDRETVTTEPSLSAASPSVAIRSAAPADIAADNRLLSSINDELSYHSAASIDTLGLREAQSKPARFSRVTD